MDRLSVESVRGILRAVKGIRAVVVGDLMLDRYVAGAVDRISPEAPVPVVRVDEEWSAVGGAGNVAANVAALGAAETWVVGAVGADAAGTELRAALERRGVRSDGLVEVPGRPTSVKTRVLARRQQIVRFDHEDESDLDERAAESVVDAVRARLAEVDVVILEDYNKGVLVPTVIEDVLAAAAERGVPTVVDPKRRNFFRFRGATVFKPNAKELADALGEFLHPDDPDWMEATRRRLDCANLLLTLGERGMAVRTVDGASERVPAVARDVYDVSGAGDTVTAVVAAALASGAPVVEAAIVANHAAAVEVGKAGVATVSPGEILEHARTYDRGAASSEAEFP